MDKSLQIQVLAQAFALNGKIVRLEFERDLYKQALQQIAKFPAAGQAQELAKTALNFSSEGYKAARGAVPLVEGDPMPEDAIRRIRGS